MLVLGRGGGVVGGKGQRLVEFVLPTKEELDISIVKVHALHMQMFFVSL
jgi:hypothetical protein